MQMSRQSNIKKIASVAMLSAIAFAITFVSKQIPFPPVAGFLKLDFKDVIVVIGGFIFGPISAAAIAIVSSFIEFITISPTGIIGLVMNVISSCTFACVASVFYKRNRRLSSAIIGLILGTVSVTVIMLLWNYILTPIYTAATADAVKAFRETVASMLLPVFLPYNLLKYGINAAFSMLLYKPLVVGLRKAGLVQERTDGKKGKVNWAVIVVAVFLVVTLAVLFLILADSK